MFTNIALTFINMRYTCCWKKWIGFVHTKRRYL